MLVHQLADGPLAAWPLQETEGVQVTDVSGNDRHGSYVNGVTYNQPPLIHGAGRSPRFSYNSSTNDYISVSTSTGTWMNVDDLTFEIVFKMSEATATHRHLLTRAQYGTAGAYNLTAGSNGSRARGQNTAYSASSAVSAVQNETNIWAMTWSMSLATMCLYRNGVLLAETPTNGQSITNTGTGNNLYIGGSPQSGYIDAGVGGWLSHAAFYDRALSADDIARHAQVAGLIGA